MFQFILNCIHKWSVNSFKLHGETWNPRHANFRNIRIWNYEISDPKIEIIEKAAKCLIWIFRPNINN